MELTKNDLMTAIDYIDILSKDILKLNIIYNQDVANKRVKYWIKDRFLISYDFNSYKWHYLRIYDFDTESEIAVEEKKDIMDLYNLSALLYEKIKNNEWEKEI